MAGSPGGKEVARVSVRAVPDTSKVRAELKADLDKIEADTKLTIPVSIDLGEASARLDEFHSKWNGKNIDFDVDAETTGAEAHLKALQAQRKINIDSSSLDSALSKVRNFGSGLDNLLRSGARLTIVPVGIAAIGAAAVNAVGQVGALVVALGRLSGVAALIPAALGSIGAIIGTTATAFSGVGAALKAATSQTSSGGSSLASSEKALAAAQTSELQAQKALTQARKDAAAQIAALSDQLTDAQLAQRQGTLDLQTAQAQLQQVISDPTSTAQARAQAQLTADQAVQALKEQGEKVTDLQKQKAAADKAGVNGSQQVIQAQQALVQAQQAVAAAQVKAAGGTNAYAAAMAKLTPNARAAVVELLSVKSQLSGIRDVVQENFFAGFAGSMAGLAAVVVPQLRTGLGGLATQLGGLTQSLFGAIASASRGGALTGFLNDVSKSVKDLRPAIQPVVAALVTLGTTGGAFLPKLAQGFGAAATQFADFLSQSAKSGALQQFIQGGLTGFAQLGHVLTGFGAIFAGLFKSLSGTGADPLSILAVSLHSIAAVINGSGFQKALSTIFTGASAGANGLASALGPIGHLLSVIAPTISGILSSSGKVVGKLLGDIASALSQPAFTKGLTGFFSGLQSGLLAIGPALPSLATALGAIGTSLGQVFVALGPQLATLIPQLADLVVATLPQLVEDIKILLPIIGPVLTALATGLAWIMKQGTPTVQLFQELTGGVKAGTIATEELSGKFGPLIQGLANFGKQVGTVIGLIGKSWRDGLNGIDTLWRSTFSGIGSFVASVVNGLIDLINGLTAGINKALSAIAVLSAGKVSLHIPKIAHVSAPRLKDSGTVLGSTDGTLVVAGDGGKDESIVDRGQLNALMAAATARASSGGDGGVTLEVTNKTGVRLSDLIDLRIKKHDNWTVIDLDGGLVG